MTRWALATLIVLIAAAPAAARGPARTVGSGVVTHADGQGFAWKVRAIRDDVGRIPGLCLEADHSWDAAGGSFGNVAGGCVAGARGRRFSLHAGGCHGVFAALGTGSLGDRTIRKLAFALDPRARKVRIRFPDGTKATTRARRAPRALRLPVRLAWRVDAGTAPPKRVTAYGRKGKVVGRWRTGTRC